MSDAGLLLGISDVTQGRGLDVKPYVATTTFDAPGASEPTPRETERDVGVDLFYNFTPSLRGNLTLNTDFAQTEVDQRLVNLTRFPLRFQEKRDFFLDGSGYFDFASNEVRSFRRGGGFRPSGVPRTEPFFSRRIGLGPDGVPQAIDVGGKLTGQMGAQDIGFVHVRTGAQTTSLGESAAGEDFTVFRLKRRVFTQSYVGSFFTRRAARVEGASDLFTSGIDFRLATSAFRGSENLSVAGYLLGSTSPKIWVKTSHTACRSTIQTIYGSGPRASQRYSPTTARPLASLPGEVSGHTADRWDSGPVQRPTRGSASSPLTPLRTS